MRAILRISVCLSVALLITVGMLAAADRTPAPSVSVSFDCWDCWEEGCPPNEHAVGILMGSIDPNMDGPTHGCSFGGCEMHGSCAELAHILAEVAPVVAVRDIRGLARLAQAYPEIVRYNPTRQAYQIEDCGGLVANVPVATP